jgi:acetyl-CoA carboxylase biotin carboxyl carrier protein
MTTSLLDPDTIRQLLRRLEATDVEELEVVMGSSRLYLRRDPGKRAVLQVAAEGEVPGRSSSGVPVIAPLTGVYYSRPTPDQPAFAEPGMTVEAGQVVALIETMKLFNEVITEVGGEIVDILAHDGDLVEAGKPIMYVRPGGEL